MNFVRKFEILQAYRENEVLYKNPVCSFHSDTKYTNHQVFLHQVTTFNIESYSADWSVTWSVQSFSI